MIDHKTAKLLESQLERYLKEMQSALTSIFDKTATYAKDKGENRRDAEENTRMNNLSKYMLGSYPNDRQNGKFNNHRRSSSKTQMMTAAVSRENFGFESSTPNGLKTVAMFANERQAGSRTPGTEGKRLMMTGMSGHDRAVAAGLFSNEQKAAINNLEDFQNKIFQKLKGRKLAAPTKKCVHELDEDPMVSINRKLAAFNLRQRSRDLNMSNNGNHTDYRGSDWFSSKAEDFIEPRTEPQYNFIESNKPNVENLRNFRQKMREKYSKEQTGGFRGKLAYSTQ